MTAEFRLQVATDPDRDDVMVELFYGEDVVATIREIDAQFRIRVYRPPAQAWDFDLAELETWLGKARERWQELGPKRE